MRSFLQLVSRSTKTKRCHLRFAFYFPRCASASRTLYDQKLSGTLPESKAAQRWQGLITGSSGCDFLVYTRGQKGDLKEVTLVIPPNHLLAFGGRLLHAGAANVGTTIPHLTLVTCSLNVSACGSFVQATRSALEVLYISMVLQKDTKPTWKSRWQVKTLGDSMIFAGMPPRAMQRSSGFSMLPDEVEAVYI